MANKILSIEIGTNLTHVVEMSYKSKSPRVYHCFSFDTPEDVQEDGRINYSDRFGNLFRQELAKRKINTKRVIFVISTSRVANREIMIPLVKENKILSLIEANSAEYFPVDLSQYQLAYQILDKIDTKDTKKYRLSIFAIPRDISTSYKYLADKCNLTLEAIDYEGNSILQGMQAEYAKVPLAVTLKVDENSTLLTITKNGNSTFQRSIAYGLDDAVNVVWDSKERISFSDAMNLMRGKNYLNTNLLIKPSDSMSQSDELENEHIKDDVTAALGSLINNVIRVLDYYTSRNPDEKIEIIHLLGLGADCNGLSKLLTNELGLQVEPLIKLTNPNLVPKSAASDFCIAEYVDEIGAAFSPLQINLNETLESKKANTPEVSFVLPILVCGLCFIAAAVLTVLSVFQTLSLKRENTALLASLTSLSSAQQTFDEFEAADNKYQEAMLMEQETLTADDQLLQFLAGLEDSMPTNVLTNSMTASADGITMVMVADQKESVAKILTQLRSFEEISHTSVTSIAEKTAENGMVTIEFTLNLRFAGTEELSTTEEVPVESDSEVPVDTEIVE